MYFPFFQREHKVHHHILSAGFFALLFIHTYLGVDALLAGPTVLEKKGEITKLERQTMSHKELAREARKLIISSRKKGKVLKLSEAMSILKTGVSQNSGRVTGLMRPTTNPQGDTSVSFTSATQAKDNSIFSKKITTLKNSRKTPRSNTTSTPLPVVTNSGSSGATSPISNESTQTFSSAPSIPSSGGSSSSSTPVTTGASSSTPSSTSGGSSTAPVVGNTNTGTSSSGSTASATGTSSGTGTSEPSVTPTGNTGATSSGSSAPSSPSTVSTGSTSTGTTSTPGSSPTSTPSSTSMISITNTENPHLKKLADYQKITGGFVGDHLMVFLNMPESAASIEGASYYIANTANEFAKFGITPIFIIEPYGDNGQLDLGKIKNGDYVAKLDSLFALLKGARGLTEDKLGLIVPYPEINTPAFNRANFVPTDLPILVNQYFDVVRKYYPNARGGLLLDGKSYEIGKSWGQGEYKSYAPYISGIKPGYISTFGVQGFPWVSADGNIKSYEPTVFLPTSLAKEAADLLSIKKIWFNTGTMKRSYPANPVYTSAEERTVMMGGIVNQGKSLVSQGYSVLIHIFAENKFQMGEGVDWSYIENASDGVLAPHEGVFASFIEGLKGSTIQVGIYDM